jgi:hypothetical protein
VARIRTVKPELFRHEGLYDLETELGIPVRLAWIGLFTIADREGRFKWRPRAIKAEVLPYDDVDFSRMLDALVTRGFLVRYTHAGNEYGWIPTFGSHQIINNRERASDCPAHDAPGSKPFEVSDLSTRESRVADAPPTPLENYSGEGKGKEGNGKERERKIATPSREEDAPRTRELLPEIPKRKEPAPTNATWEAYREAYNQRYHVDPTRNATVNGQLANFIKRVPSEEAPAIAAFYVEHNHGLYLNSGHAIGLLLRDAEKLRTEWLTGKRITRNTVRAVETSDHFTTQLKEIAEGRL